MRGVGPDPKIFYFMSINIKSFTITLRKILGVKGKGLMGFNYLMFYFIITVYF